MLPSLPDAILSIIFPQVCRVCRGEVRSQHDGIACSGCWESTKIFNSDEALCSKCGAFLLGAPASQFTPRCAKCVDHSYDRAFAVGAYEKALSASILYLKRTPYISRRLSDLLTTCLDRFAIEPSAIVIPVPLSSRRRQERGFNQATIIGRIVEKHGHLIFDEQTLIRKIHTPMHRAGMDRKARAMTVKNAFEVARPRLIEGRSVLLVDDILTSGETASNCAKVLKKNGATTVNVMTIARAA